MIWNLFSKQKRPEPAIGKSTTGIKPVVLVILDGFGIAPPSEGNAITRAKTPNLNRFYTRYPSGELLASGESVGLPANEEGNSEVGHLTLGAGTVILQSLKRINASVADGTFFENTAFLNAVSHVKKYNSKMHLMGLVSTGSVHSNLKHLYALIDFCARAGLQRVYLHLFTDGRDAPPQEGAKVIREIEEKIGGAKVGMIATVAGRYYAMDRDMRWERTQKAYEAIVLGKGVVADSAEGAVRNSYEQGKTDEFVEPTVIVKQGKPLATVDNNDAVIFFNFRVDRPRQLTMAFVMPDFENLKPIEIETPSGQAKKERIVVSGKTFKREKRPKNVFFVTMTQYQKNITVSDVAFPPITAETSLPKVLSEHSLRQLHLAESEKERMVTIYFNGLCEGRLPKEDVFIVPSPKVSTYDKRPEMSIYEIVDQLKKALSVNAHHFYVLNFANPDMVAHSGDVKATIKAIEHVDKALGEVAKAVLALDGTLIITADHGNAEELLTFPATSYFFTSSRGDVNTDHSSNPVPVIIISNKFDGKSIKLPKGTLSDIAPTILTMMKISIPPQMTGKDLLAEIEAASKP